MPTLLPVPEDVVRVASLALERRAERGGGTARGVAIASALVTGVVRPYDLAEIRSWHARNPDGCTGNASTLIAGLYGGAPARAWTAAAMNPAGEGAMIALPVPDGVSVQIARPDGEPPEEMHLTLFHFGGNAADLDPALRDSVLAVLGQVIPTLPPPVIDLSHVERFSLNDDGVEPVVVVSDSPDVYALRAALEEALTAQGIEFSDGHAFRAHVTIGYYPPGEGPAAGPVQDVLGKGPWTFTPASVALHWATEVDHYGLGAPVTAAISDPLDVIRTPTAATPTPLRKKLGKLSATVNRSDRQTMLKLHSAATVAFNEALNRAPGWLAGKARTKTARAALEAAAGVYAPAVYAAVGVTEQEFLNRRFDTFAAYAVGVIATAERRKLTAAARALGLDPDAVEAEYGAEIDRRATAAATMMVASLAILARSALSGHGITAETAVGEFSGPVPFGIVRDALTISSRGASAPAIDETGVGPAAIDELSQRLTDIGSTLVEDLLAANDVRVQVRSTWVHSGNDRPFLPHLDVDGVSWVDTQPPELDWDEGEFPYVSVLQPGDHPGCDCMIETELEPYEGDAGDGESALVGASASGDTPE